MNTSRLGCLAVLSLVAAGLPADEVAPPASLPCFPGAIYRKAVSSEDRWTGIDGVVTLPTFSPDPNRVGPNGRPLDNPSCYIGGRSGDTEIDAGVSFEVIKEPDGSVSKSRKAFRPFWRNKKWFTAPAEPELYFYPGDTIRLACRTTAKDKLTLRVELLARAMPDHAAPTTLPAAPLATFETTLDAFGFAPGNAQQFKRVTAIDQVANEGKPASQTTATSIGAIWSSVELLRGDDDRRPMTAARFTDMRCPDVAKVRVDPVGTRGDGERIELRGTPGDGR